MKHQIRVAVFCVVFAFGARAQQIVPESPEPNAYPGFTGIQCGQQGDGVIGAASDMDYWRVQFSGPGTLRAVVGPGYNLPRCQDTIVELRDASNTLLASNDDGAGIGLYSELRDCRIPGAGSYYIVVRGYTANTGSYSLDVSCGPPGPAWSLLAEPAEPNNTNASAGNVACWQRCSAAIAFAGDFDRYSFTASAGQRITISTGPGDTGAALTDSILTLRNPAGAVLASNDDSLGLYARVSYVVPTSGTYYVDVAGYLNQVIGTYNLEFECSGILPYPASLTTLGVGCMSSFGQIPQIQRRTSLSGVTYVERPLIGTTMVADLTQCPPLCAAFVAAGLQEQNPPIDLGLIGAPGCLALINPLVLDLHLASVTGYANWTLAVPYDTNLNGVTIEYQAVILDIPANSLGLIVSNRLRAIVGNSF